MCAPGQRPLIDWLRRVIASGSAILALALVVFAASPVAHAWLHSSTQSCHGQADLPAAPEDDCAIVLFASGVALPAGPTALLPPVLAPRGASPCPAAEFYLVSPRYLRQPERGPPLARAS